MPRIHAMPVDGRLPRRRAPHHGYGRSHYLPRPLRETRAAQPIFRIT
jgi:hypothetical protein